MNAIEKLPNTQPHHPLWTALRAGCVAVVRGWIWGYLLGFAAVTAAYFITILATRVVKDVSGAGWIGVDTTLDSVFWIVDIGVAALVGGLVVNGAVSSKTQIDARIIRRVTMPLGAVILLMCALFVWSGPLDWLGVVALLLLPAWWILGTWRTEPFSLRFPRRLVLGLAILIWACVLSNFVIGPTSPTSPNAPIDMATWSTQFAKIGAPASPQFYEGLSVGLSGGGQDMSVAVAMSDSSGIDGWHDFRVDAWTATSPEVGNGVDASETQPFLSAPVQRGVTGSTPDNRYTWDSVTPWPVGGIILSGQIHLGRVLNVGWCWITLTGVAPDGVRYLISGPVEDNAHFDGTAFDWIEAVLSGK